MRIVDISLGGGDRLVGMMRVRVQSLATASGAGGRDRGGGCAVLVATGTATAIRYCGGAPVAPGHGGDVLVELVDTEEHGGSF